MTPSHARFPWSFCTASPWLALRALGLLSVLVAVPAVAQTFDLGVRVDLATGALPYTVATGDLNGDGWLDVVTSNYTANSISVLLGTGGGGYATKTDYATGSSPQLVVIAEVNGDGKPDLAVANKGSGTVSVRLGNGAGGFGPKTPFPTAAGPRMWRSET